MGGECRQRSTAARAWQTPAGFLSVEILIIWRTWLLRHILCFIEPLPLATLRSTKLAPSPAVTGRLLTA